MGDCWHGNLKKFLGRDGRLVVLQTGLRQDIIDSLDLLLLSEDIEVRLATKL